MTYLWQSASHHGLVLFVALAFSCSPSCGGLKFAEWVWLWATGINYFMGQRLVLHGLKGLLALDDVTRT